MKRKVQIYIEDISGSGDYNRIELFDQGVICCRGELKFDYKNELQVLMSQVFEYCK